MCFFISLIKYPFCNKSVFLPSLKQDMLTTSRMQYVRPLSWIIKFTQQCLSHLYSQSWRTSIRLRLRELPETWRKTWMLLTPTLTICCQKVLMSLHGNTCIAVNPLTPPPPVLKQEYRAFRTFLTAFWKSREVEIQWTILMRFKIFKI